MYMQLVYSLAISLALPSREVSRERIELISSMKSLFDRWRITRNVIQEC